jgi:hypothetical protein
MGFHVVSRLARRYGIDVSLAHSPGGGVTALVSLPDALVSERRIAPVAPLTPAAGMSAVEPPPTAAPAPGLDGVDRADPADRAVDRAARENGADRVDRTSRADRAGMGSPARPAHVQLVPVELTADGLQRRVPGAGLSPSLRRPAAHLARSPREPGERDQMRSMLSRFQASQRAGRAVANAPAGSLAPVPTPPEEEET